MSTYVEKLFISISSALEFNTATLSGAIDIVVTEDDTGKRRCSPFHVRFGKLQLLKSRGIPVNLELNGCPTNLSMLLGAAGEAYFYHPPPSPNPRDQSSHALSNVFHTPPDVPTVPLETHSSPTPSTPSTPHASSSKQHDQTFDLFPDHHSTADSEHTPLSLHESSDEASQSDDHIQCDNTPPSISQQCAFAHVSDSEVELSRTQQDRSAEFVHEPRSQPLTSYEHTWDSVLAQSHDTPLRLPPSPASNRPVRRKPRHRISPSSPPSPSSSSNTPSSSSASSQPSKADLEQVVSDQHAATQEEHTHASPTEHLQTARMLPSVMAEALTSTENNLDRACMDHTDVDDIDDDDTDDNDTEFQVLEPQGAAVCSKPSPSSTPDACFEPWCEVQIDANPTDNHSGIRTSFRKGLRLSLQNATPVPSGDALPLSSSEGLHVSPGEDRLVPSGEDRSVLSGEGPPVRSGDGLIALSLCGQLLSSGMKEEDIMELFELHQVTASDFEKRPNLLFDQALMVKIDNRIFDFRVAAAFIFSLVAFPGKADIDGIAKLLATKPEDEPSKSPPTPSRRFRWFGWSSAPAEDEPLLEKDGPDKKTPNVATVTDPNSSDPTAVKGSALDNGSLERESEDFTESNGVQSKPGTGELEEPQAINDKSSPGETRRANDRNTSADLNGASKSAVSHSGTEQGGETSSKAAHSLNREEREEKTPQTSARKSGFAGISFENLDETTLSLRPSEEELMRLDLKPGANTLRFIVESSSVELSCRIFFWSCHTKIVISDVDGTITRSDVLGHLLPAVGRDWSQVGVAGLYSQIEKNGYKLLYLTARPIGQASQTRTFLHNVTQGSTKLPNGPVLMSPNRLVESFTREVIHRKPHEFKIAALRDVRGLFLPHYNPFHAGFGNRDTDVISYRAVGLIPQRIFVVNPRGELVVTKARYESAACYTTLQDLVESVFPDITQQSGLDKVLAVTESAMFNDWNYWRDSLPDIDLDALIETGK